MPSTEGARIEAPNAPREVGSGDWAGVSPSQQERSGEGAVPHPILKFLSGIGAFWCILGTCFNVSVLVVRAAQFRRTLTGDDELLSSEVTTLAVTSLLFMHAMNA